MCNYLCVISCPLNPIINTGALKKIKKEQGLPGDPAAETLCSPCRGPGVLSLVREPDPTWHN